MSRRHPLAPLRAARRALVAATLAAVTAFSAVAMTAAPATAVANGEPVPQGRYRFAVKLTMTDIPRPDGSLYDSACSGALVAPRWVITAGHCFHDPYRNPVSGPVPYPTTATVGRVTASGPGGHVVSVVEVRQAAGTDVALARLDRVVRGVRPIGIRSAAPSVGQILRLTGWGATGPGQGPSERLMTGRVRVATVAATTVGVRGHDPAPDTSACLYDSGAPYFLERRGAAPLLVSVESTGPDCPHAEIETTARVDTLASWIRRTIR